MPGDRSRRFDASRHGYTGVVAQQGRVILDRDFNAAQALTTARMAADALDEIGPCGTPDDGFRIAVPDPFAASPPLVTPVVSPPISPGGANDFTISPGTMYVGGQRVEFPRLQNGTPVSYSYFDQPDWPAPPSTLQRRSTGTSLNVDIAHKMPETELVLLHVTEQEVSAVEDPDLFEVALGGADTTQRLKMLRRVRRLPVDATDCATAWQSAIDNWNAAGLLFDPATMRLLPAVRLLVGFTEADTDTDPCDPVTTGGFLGPDNQLIRVRINTTSESPQLVWGYDNASFLYRATVDPTDHTQLSLAGGPPDSFHFPIVGQVVEVLETAAVLGLAPNEIDGGFVDRVAARATGRLYTLDQAYGPTTASPSNNVLVLPTALPGPVVSSTLPLFVRVWQSSVPIDPAGGTYTLVDAAGHSTGISVTISIPDGTALAHGTYWQIAARPSTPQGVYPADLLLTPQPPDGPREWACPLAVINWADRTVADCRNNFDNLVTLTRRRPGCCTVSISPTDVSSTTSLQTLINRAVETADKVTVCLTAGRYPLPTPLMLSAAHDGLTLESCGGPAVLSVAAATLSSEFFEGLIVVARGTGVTLRGLTLLPPIAPLPAAVVRKLLSSLPGDLAAAGRLALGDPAVGFGVRAVHASDLTVEDCSIQFLAQSTDARIDLVAAGVFLQGSCAGLSVRGCAFLSNYTPTFTRLSVDETTTALPVLETFTRALDSLHLALAPASPPAETATVLDSQVIAGLDALIAKRAALPFATQIPSVIATLGVLADSAISKAGADVNTVTICDLGAGSIRDNVFTGFTFATWISAHASNLRIQDNTVTGGVAGFWLEVPGAIAPTAPNPEKPNFYPEILDFEEFVIARALPTLLIGDIGQIDRKGEGFDLHFAGNQVRLRSSGVSTAALFLSLIDPKSAQAQMPDLTAIVTGNQLRSWSGNTGPAAMLLLSTGMPCAITGNIILNSTISDNGQVAGPSLTIEVDRYGDGTELLAVTGNVLNGQSDLMHPATQLNLNRRGIPPANNWHLYNADPN
jgi:hypothetical protein